MKAAEAIMAYKVQDLNVDLGNVVGNGQCVAFVQQDAGCPHTSRWAQGANVRSSPPAAGTAIATFQSGKYNNYTDGRSHAAIYISQDETGLTVHDQWTKQVVHMRVIRFQNGAADPRNDGDAFSVIEPVTLWYRINLTLRKVLRF